MNCKFHPRRTKNIIFVTYQTPCGCGEIPMYAACKDCALSLAMLAMVHEQCGKAPSGVVMASFDEGVFFQNEEMTNND